MRFIKILAVAGLGMGSAQADEVVQLPAITIVGHYANAVGTSDAASQGVVTSRLVEHRPALRPGEILEFVPGMIVTQHSGGGKANQYFLRGFNLDHGTDFATYVDAMPANMRTHAHGQGYTDLNFLIPELVQRISYRKGPYFADEGDFSSAGAAHLHLANRLPQGMASVSLGENGYQRYLFADSNPLGQGHLLYALEANFNNGPWDTREKLGRYNGVLRYSEGTHDHGFNITAMAYRNRWNATDQIPQRAVDTGQLGRFAAIDTTDGGSSSRYSLSYGLRKRSANSLLAVNAYAVQSGLDLFSNFTYALDNPADGDQFNQSERRRMFGLNIARTWFVKVGGLDMQNRVGLQSRYDRLSPIGLYATVGRERISTIREDRVKEGSVGLYAENTTQWFDWLRTVAGIRYDDYRFDVSSDTVGNSGKVSAGISSPKFSLVLGPWGRTEYFINHGKGFHSNDARGSTQTQLPGGGGTTVPVTALVGTRGSEIGMRTEAIPGLQSSLALWQLEVESELVFVGDAGATEPSRSSRRRGIEWSNHYIARPWLMFDLDVATSHARYRDDDPAGQYIPGAMAKVIAFGVTVTDMGRWSGAFQMRYFGPRPLIEDNSIRSKSTALGYVRIGYKIDRQTRLVADVFNVFNRKASDIDYYYRSRLNGEPASGTADIHFHPVEPRTLRLTLIHNF